MITYKLRLLQLTIWKYGPGMEALADHPEIQTYIRSPLTAYHTIAPCISNSQRVMKTPRKS
jgi:hypothetical protein